jgi:hypothetical protein
MMERYEPPNSRTHVSTSGSEQTALDRAGCDRNDRVFVSLKHELGITSLGIPELNTPVF